MSHKIDPSSPLYTVSPRDLTTAQFEIIITLEGTTPETSSTVQVTILFNIWVCLCVSSPLDTVSPRDLTSAQFEIIITLEGTTLETSSTVQVYIFINVLVCLYVIEVSVLNRPQSMRKF